MTDAIKSVHVVIKGRVQGVSFRASTAQEARALHVFGWVRNLPDGSVEAHFEGREDAVMTLLGWCKKGSPWAKVESLEWCDVAPERRIHFEVRR